MYFLFAVKAAYELPEASSTYKIEVYFNLLTFERNKKMRSEFSSFIVQRPSCCCCNYCVLVGYLYKHNIYSNFGLLWLQCWLWNHSYNLHSHFSIYLLHSGWFFGYYFNHKLNYMPSKLRKFNRNFPLVVLFVHLIVYCIVIKHIKSNWFIFISLSIILNTWFILWP